MYNNEKFFTEKIKVMIRLDSVSKSFSRNQSKAVDSLSLSVSKGEIMVILGESGSGKSTCLKMINRILEPSAGSIFINNINIKERDPVKLRRNIGYVIQEIGLFPHMTVAENISVVPKLLEWNQSEIDNRINELLNLFKLPPQEYSNRFPDQLSGGQKQRVGVARALAGNAEILLMDEPFGALDPITRDSLQKEFKELQKQMNLTVVMVTHDINEALFLADRIAVMKDGKLLLCDTVSKIVNNKSIGYIRDLMSMPRKQLQRLSSLIVDDNNRDESGKND